jgi:anti-anti-sigma factor
MKPHLTLSTTNHEMSLSEAAPARPHLTLASPPAWRHKLILTGRLDHRSAAELEEEIECLCQEGVTILTLDLSQLDAIDAAGARTIAFRGALCKRRGHDLEVIPGSSAIHHALAEAGITDLLAPDPSETVVRRFSSHSADSSCPDRSTVMIKSL